MEDQLATEQYFAAIEGPQTEATEFIKQAAAAFHERDMTRSANLFMKSWRILRCEIENYENGPFKQWLDQRRERSVAGSYGDPEPELDDEARRQHELRSLMSICTLSDLSLACLRNEGEFRDDKGKSTLNIYPLINGKRYSVNSDSITAQQLKCDGTTWPARTKVSDIVELKDPIGDMLEFTQFYSQAAHHFAFYALYKTSVGFIRGHSDLRTFAVKTLYWIFEISRSHYPYKDRKSSEPDIWQTRWRQAPDKFKGNREWETYGE